MEENDIVEINDNVEEVEIKDPKKVLDALERAKADAKKNREEKEEIKKNWEEAMNQLHEWSAKLTIERAERQIRKSGLPNSDKLRKYIDFDRITFNDQTLEIEGLQEQIEELKVEYPELFDPKIVFGGKVDAGVDSPVKTSRSVSELQARALLGK